MDYHKWNHAMFFILVFLAAVLIIVASTRRRPPVVQEVKREAGERLDTQNIRNIEAREFIGKPCIFVPNEWENPVVGFVESVETDKGIVTFVHNYVDNKVCFFFGMPMHYNEQRFEALMKLDPFERCSLVFARAYDDSEFVKAKAHTADDRETIVARLREHGFYDRLKALAISDKT